MAELGVHRKPILWPLFVLIQVGRLVVFPAWAARRLFDDPNSGEFLNAIRRTRLPEEFFLPTYFLNSEVAPLVVRDKLRNIDWRPEREQFSLS